MKLAQHPEYIKAKKEFEAVENALPVDMSSWSDEQHEEHEAAENALKLVRNRLRSELAGV